MDKNKYRTVNYVLDSIIWIGFMVFMLAGFRNTLNHNYGYALADFTAGTAIAVYIIVRVLNRD